MKSTFNRFICRMLAAGMIVLPFHAQAGLIGTDRAASAPMATNAISRGELSKQLQALGLSPEAAGERVAALTDAEIAGLAGRAGDQPAGGIAGQLWIAVVVFLVWRFTASDQAKAETGKGAPKPAPEKK